MRFTIFIPSYMLQLFIAISCSTVNIVENLNEKCPYKDTVNLTGYTPFNDSSYLYQNVVISANNVSQYNYRLSFQNKRHPVELHTRGCICGNPKYCVKLCCESGEFFNETSFACQQIPYELNMPTDLNITSNGSRKIEMNIFENFIYQVGVPCKYPESMTMERDIWDVLENGILYIANDDTYLDTVNYCLTPYRYSGQDDFNVLVPMSCPMKTEMTSSLMLNSYAPALTVIFLIPTVLVYLLLKELRDNMRGKLLISYLISLIVSYSIISYINISEHVFGDKMCCILGFTCYFFFMAAFMWLSVLCFDIWINFKDHKVASNCKRNKIRFMYYSIYCWGIASLLTFLVMGCQWSGIISEKYKPGIGDEICWLDTSKWSAAIYFYLPNLIILIFSMFTFVHLIARIYRVRSNIARITQKEQFFKDNILVILRIFIILGISWLLDILSYFLRDYEEWYFLEILSDFRNAIQGILIFILFVLKRNVLDSLKKLFRSTATGTSRVSSKFARFSKLSVTSARQTELELI